VCEPVQFCTSSKTVSQIASMTKSRIFRMSDGSCRSGQVNVRWNATRWCNSGSI